MIKELNKNYEPNWNEEIEIKLSLRDLQLIYDCVGAVPLSYINYKHENTKFTKRYDATFFTTVYDELDDLIVAHNGVNDESLNINKMLEMKDL